VLIKAFSREFSGLETEDIDPSAYGYENIAGHHLSASPLGEPDVPTIDAVVVCCDCRRPLTYAVETAMELNCPLFVYHDVSASVDSDQAREAAIRSLQVPGIDAIQTFYYPLRRDEPKPWPQLRLRPPRLSRETTCGRLCDLRTKAMADTHIAGCQRILMLDDDISVDPALVHAASRAMTEVGYAAIGFRVADVSDRGIFDHIFTLDPRLNLEIFKDPQWVAPPSGGAVLLNPSRCIAHSPPLYNEDWVVFNEMLRRGFRVGVMGEARQYCVQNFDDASVRAQSAGEIFAEGLTFAAKEINDPLQAGMWQRIISVRLAKLTVLRQLLIIIEDRARLSEYDSDFISSVRPLKNRDEVARTIGLLERCYADFKPKMFVDLYQQWQADESRFQAWLVEQQPSRASAAEAPKAHVQQITMVTSSGIGMSQAARSLRS
jgi:hypothetical protein